MERTLVLLKPDSIQRGLAGEVISRLERRGLKFVAMKLMKVSDELANRHYGEHAGKPFFDGLVKFITSSPIVAMVVEGESAVEVVRNTMGTTNPIQAGPGTIRGDLGLTIGMNLIHGSDSPESAKKEIDTFFKPEEIVDYTRNIDAWIIEA
ncbi:MAG: nucleoside-diphosphate kinase [SAR202 cluster bacterium Casp-Chloro-G4]|nr:nucleoside-diphosphate kinase [Chloroflexota bacterium]MDA1226455.1 nucleoside-diphosphate kinase [Chloroflexota bacterium]PKB61072.1 MAG: nucleoside-diphosphate kinase [SAR202 cluster bacterium Casp-Chloro-G4]